MHSRLVYPSCVISGIRLGMDSHAARGNQCQRASVGTQV